MSQYIEVINSNYPRGDFRFAVFDFDGTLSLIREGWQKIMKDYFYEELIKAPASKDEPEASLRACIDEFVDVNTGKQTIYQCFGLVDAVKNRGGVPLDALDYKDEYTRRLMAQIDYRIKGLEDGSIDPADYTVPGGIDFLKDLKARNVSIFIASGTDEVFAEHEAELLDTTKYLAARVYGAQRDYKSFSKRMVIERIMKENSLQGAQLMGFGDGFVEIENIKEHGGFAVGLATDEKHRDGRIDEWKRERLIRAGADIIIPDFSHVDELMRYLYPEGGHTDAV